MLDDVKYILQCKDAIWILKKNGCQGLSKIKCLCRILLGSEFFYEYKLSVVIKGMTILLGMSAITFGYLTSSVFASLYINAVSAFPIYYLFHSAQSIS